MPPRLTTQEVKDLFSEYGYQVPANFVYRNNKTPVRVYDEQNEVHENLTLQQLRYRINRAATLRQPYFDRNLMNLPISNDQRNENTAFDRWCAKQNDIDSYDDEFKHKAFDYYKQAIPTIARKRNSNFDFDSNNNIAQLYGFVSALKTIDYSNFDVRLTIRDTNNNISYCHANANTINFLMNSFNTVQDVGDSSDVLLNNLCDVQSIYVEFRPLNNNGRAAPGFFPYINKSNINLSHYGIYNNEKDIINESCLITAIRSSGLLNDENMKLLQSMIKTRNVMKSDLRKISDMFQFNVRVQIIKDEKGKDCHYDIKHNEKYPTLKLVVIYDHYILNKTTIVPEFGKRPMSPFNIIKKLKEKNLLQPLSEKTIKKLILTYEHINDNGIVCDMSYRPLIVKQPKIKKWNLMHKVNQSKRFFGYVPEENEINERLQELQKAIDTLPLRHPIKVSDYYRFSELGQIILFETGCYDGVYELTGKMANDIRSTLKFPQTKITNGETFYSNERLYYLDLNAAYMNFVKYIPSGIDNHANHKVDSIIKQLYELRQKSKREGKDKLATTLKFIMNSTWGYSIQRPKVLKNKYVQNVDGYVERFGKFVLKVSGNFVTTVNTFVPHYTFPQFAKSVLDEYNKFFDKIKSIVPVFYENVDAILTNEDGYNKLNELGYIGEEMGKFKLDKIFTEIAIISNKKYVATTDKGERIFHCIKDIPYENVVNKARFSD